MYNQAEQLMEQYPAYRNGDGERTRGAYLHHRVRRKNIKGI